MLTLGWLCQGAEAAAKWGEGFEAYTAAHPAQAAEIKRRFSHELPENWKVRAGLGDRR